MAVVHVSYFDYSVIKMEGEKRALVVSSDEFIEKIRDATVKPDGTKYTEEELRYAMWTNPRGLLQGAKAAYGTDIHTWETGTLVTEEVDVGSLVGRKIHFKDKDGLVHYGKVVSETDVEDPNSHRIATMLHIKRDDGKLGKYPTYYSAGWAVKLDDGKWYEAHDLAKQAKAERAGAKFQKQFAQRRWPDVHVRQHRRRA